MYINWRQNLTLDSWLTSELDPISLNIIDNGATGLRTKLLELVEHVPINNGIDIKGLSLEDFEYAQRLVSRINRCLSKENLFEENIVNNIYEKIKERGLSKFFKCNQMYEYIEHVQNVICEMHNNEILDSENLNVVLKNDFTILNGALSMLEKVCEMNKNNICATLNCSEIGQIRLYDFSKALDEEGIKLDKKAPLDIDALINEAKKGYRFLVLMFKNFMSDEAFQRLMLRLDRNLDYVANWENEKSLQSHSDTIRLNLIDNYNGALSAQQYYFKEKFDPHQLGFDCKSAEVFLKMDDWNVLSIIRDIKKCHALNFETINAIARIASNLDGNGLAYLSECMQEICDLVHSNEVRSISSKSSKNILDFCAHWGILVHAQFKFQTNVSPTNMFKAMFQSLPRVEQRQNVFNQVISLCESCNMVNLYGSLNPIVYYIKSYIISNNRNNKIEFIKK